MLLSIHKLLAVNIVSVVVTVILVIWAHQINDKEAIVGSILLLAAALSCFFWTWDTIENGNY